MGLIGVRRGGRTVMPAPIESPSNTKNRKPGFAPGFPQWTTTPGRQRSGLQLPEGCATHSPHGALVRRDSQIPREGGRNTAIFGVDPETRLARILNPDRFMEPRPGRLPELEATRPHMEPKASCPTAAPLVERKFHVLVGVTGSVAALKSPLLVSKLLDIPGLEVAVVTTERAKHFYSPQDIPVTLYSDADEWEMWKSRSDPVLHIDLRRWADLLLVAPLDANTLGKVASGICDNLLTCVIRAWDRSKPLLFCPAMNTAMWEHPITAQQVDQLKAFGYVEIPCVAKKLVCGDEGLGAMAEVGTIVDKVKEVLFQHSGFQQS
ncbi:PREDICTED: phosphopantothenoylcysteine decarboxylase isoform X1 [Cercocebus atys]|nr:PREDICTED: phosphopantothenoylcysteine decarboxylase isoform X1 [Cercocebus atys]